MKYILVLFFLFCVLLAKSQTSVYHPFPDSNAVWNFEFQSYCWFPSGNIIQTYSKELTGDTTINSLTYHKLSTPFVVTNMSCGSIGGSSTGYQGAIRQDTAMRKVFYIPPTDSVEQLLYDFNMQVGDTVQGFLENWANPVDTVISMDSVLVGTDYRKRWHINTCYNISLIEGIGSDYGLIIQSPGCITDGGDFTLLCFKQDNVTLYPGSASSCELITSLPQINTKLAGIDVYPNPLVDFLIIDFEKQFIGTIELSDIAGRKIEFQNFNGNYFKANYSYLNTGVYMLEIRNSAGEIVRTQKLVKE